MTVLKRQVSNPAGVSSEVEVLKALKSLFEHHKALDEKVRERLRLALERSTHLESELSSASQELSTLRNNQEQRKTLTNGNTEADSEASRVAELTSELMSARRQLNELSLRLKEMEEGGGSGSGSGSGEGSRAQLLERLEKLQRDLRESLAQRNDQEERIATLEQRYLAAQRESTTLQDVNAKLETECGRKDEEVAKTMEKMQKMQEKLEQQEQQLAFSKRRAEALPNIEAELAERSAALSRAEEQQDTASEKVSQSKAEGTGGPLPVIGQIEFSC